MITDEQRKEIVEESLTWLNTPYHHQGTIKGVGTDCAMILIKIFHKLGYIPDIDPRPYPSDWHLHRNDEIYLSWIDKYATKTTIPNPGCIALFKFGRCISHGAIVIQYPIILHAVLKERKVILSDMERSEELKKRLFGFYDIKGEQCLS